MKNSTAAILAPFALAAILAVIAFGAGEFGLRAEQHRLTQLRYAPPPETMVFVPAGEFFRGSDDAVADPDEGPLRRSFTKAFYIDAYEVTNEQFAQFDPTHTYLPERANWPVTGIAKEAAMAYAESLGKRLPTSAEWEKAARGADGCAYPWGNEFQFGRANLANDGLAPVGSFPEGVSPYGAHDMAGNAWEWTSDVYRDKGRLGAGSIERNIIKGGGYSYNPFQGRAAYQGFESIGATCNDLGFRCVKDAVPIEE